MLERSTVDIHDEGVITATEAVGQELNRLFDSKVYYAAPRILSAKRRVVVGIDYRIKVVSNDCYISFINYYIRH